MSTSTNAVRPSATTAQRLLERGLRLEYATLAWNLVGSVVVITAAVRAHSVGLAGFGLDSLVEIIASLVVVWQLRGIADGRERLALRIIGISFLGLAAYIAVQSVYVLVAGARPHHSLFGIGWLGATVLAMFALAWGKGRTGQELGNRVLETESRVTMIDGYLAAAVLVGLLLNALAGWWWADPLAGFVIVGYGLHEGMHALREAA